MKGFNRRDVIQNAATFSVAGALLGSHLLRISKEAKGSEFDRPVTNSSAKAVLDLPSSAEVGSLVPASGLRSMFSTRPLCTPEFSFDWGDGTSPSGPAEVASHRYTETGVYTVRLVVLTPQNGELNTVQKIEITARETPPVNAVSMIDQLTGQVSELSFDLELKTAALNLLVVAKQQAQFAQAHRIPVRGTKIYRSPRQTSRDHPAKGSLDPNLSMVHFLGAAHSVIGAQDPLILAKQRGQITDGQLQDVALQSVLLVGSLYDEAELQVLQAPDDTGGYYCRRRCDTFGDELDFFAGVVTTVGIGECLLFELADPITLIVFGFNIVECVDPVLIKSANMRRAINAYRTNCYNVCSEP